MLSQVPSSDRFPLTPVSSVLELLRQMPTHSVAYSNTLILLQPWRPEVQNSITGLKSRCPRIPLPLGAQERSHSWDLLVYGGCCSPWLVHPPPPPTPDSAPAFPLLRMHVTALGTHLRIQECLANSRSRIKSHLQRPSLLAHKLTFTGPRD